MRVLPVLSPVQLLQVPELPELLPWERELLPWEQELLPLERELLREQMPVLLLQALSRAYAEASEPAAVFRVQNEFPVQPKEGWSV